MNFDVTQLLAALPEIFLLSMICLLLLIDAFLPRKHALTIFILAEFTLVLVFLITLPQFKVYLKPISLFNGNYVVDELAIISKLVIYLFSFFAFIYSREYITKRQFAVSEYYLLGLVAVLGMSIMVSAFNFLTLFLGIELLSLPLYAMVAMHKESGRAAEAALKYFVLGSLATGLFLYGISLIYGATGQIQLDTIAQLLKNRHDMVPLVGLIFILSGLIFKFGAVPFHMWVPDVYQGAGTPVTLFIASAPKVAAFAVIVRVLVQALPSFNVNWEYFLILVSVLSMFFGNVLAIAQNDLKRMLAYSSIAHIGYTLLGVLAGPNSTQGYSAAMFYITTYVLVAAGGFAVITVMSRNGIDLDDINDYRGLNARHSWLAFIMLLLLFSMAGVPPTVGFFAKLGLIEALVAAHLVWLAVLALIFALIGAYYYLRVVMLMYFEEPVAGTNQMPITISYDMLAAISVNGAAALMLGLFPSFLIDLCRISVG